MYVSLQSVQKNQQFFSRSVKDIKIEAKSFGIFGGESYGLYLCAPD
jgi:hypothetical protein